MDGYEEFKRRTLALTGIDLSSYKEKQMRRRIDSLVSRNKCSSYDEYVRLLRTDSSVFSEFINFLTINVSEFYRNPDQWEILDKVYFPELISRFGKKLNIWSAACSTGDEPYSLVMALSRHVPLNDIRIIATDIDRRILEQAKTGLYNEKSIKNVPADLKKRYFRQIGPSFQISDEIKRCVSFRESNLLCDRYPGDLDMIVCRNVLIYFTEEAKEDIYRKFHRSLKSGGVLFIGSTEQVSDYREIGFGRRNSFFYDKL